MIPEFPHKAPKNYSYVFEKHNNRFIRIDLVCNRQFDYNLGKNTRTVWGFYSPKRREYYAPINYKTVGSLVDIDNTRPWTAMQIKQTPLEAAFS